MKQTVTAVIALALGAGLAAGAMAQGTYNQSTAPPLSSTQGIGTMQATAPSATMQSTAPSADMQATAPRAHKQRVSSHRLGNRQQIRQTQLRLKSEGLYRGRVSGIMNKQTRIALSARSESRLHRTRLAHARLHKAQTTGIGSSVPNTQMTPPAATNAPTGAGGTTSTGQTLPTTGQSR